MEKPSQTDLQTRVGISQAYASLILSGGRQPSRPLAIRIYREFGWKPECIADLTEDQIATLEAIEPWQPRNSEAGKAAA